MRRNQYFLHSQFFCHLACMKRAGASECHQAKFADIISLFYGYASDCTNHVGIYDCDNTVRCTFHIQIGFITNFCLDSVFSQFNIYIHSAAKNLLLIQLAKNNIGICYARILTAAHIAGRSRCCTRTLRSYL